MTALRCATLAPWICPPAIMATGDSRWAADMDRDEVSRLPVVVDLVTAARALGIGRTVAYQLVREGAWPTPVLRIGNQIKVPSAPLLALLGLSADTNPEPARLREIRHGRTRSTGAARAAKQHP